MGRWKVASVSLALLVSTVACTELDDPNAGDELSDFASTSAVTAGMPYDVYVRLAQSSGAEVLGFPEAEARAATLCQPTGVIEDPQSAGQDDWSSTDRALVRAYCPSVEVGG